MRILKQTRLNILFTFSMTIYLTLRLEESAPIIAVCSHVDLTYPLSPSFIQGSPLANLHFRFKCSGSPISHPTVHSLVLHHLMTISVCLRNRLVPFQDVFVG